MLDLSKGQVIELKKEDGSAVTKIRVGGGWDTSKSGKANFDLDLSAICNDGSVCYFSKKELPGISLDKDNVTGEGSGADENMHFDASKMTAKKVLICINIFNAASKGQSFRDVENAFIEIEDKDTKKMLAKYNISADGGANDALLAGELEVVNGAFKFTAKGVYAVGDLNQLVAQFKPTV